MFNFLEKLRQKPPHIRKQIAFLVAFSIAGIIFVIWLSVIYPDFRQKQDQEEKISQLEPSPVSSFGQTLTSGISAIKEQFGQLKSAVSSFTTDQTHYSAPATDTNMTASTVFTSVGTSTNQ